MRPDLRLGVALAAGRAAASASRLLRLGGGQTAPGDVIAAIAPVDPGALRKLSGSLSRGAVLVTGTNGKTTTTGMIAAALRHAGVAVATNASGANLVFGLIATVAADADLRGRPHAEIAVLEVDELHLERAVQEMRPRIVVVLNLLRDQLDRAGELETTAGRIGDALRALPPDARVVAVTDDPLVFGRCEDLPGLVRVGIDADDHLLAGLPHCADARACPRCEAPLRFDRVVLAHCGTYSCTSCGFARPAPDTAVTRIAAPALDRLVLELGDGACLETAVGGVYNAYNAVAAYAALRAVGLDAAAARDGIASFTPRFGRQEKVHLFGRDMRFLLAKNPSGFDEVLRAADELGDARLYLIAINDGVADGRDVSWLWDVDFERLARSSRAPVVVAAGRRAHDLAVRLKYAGVDPARVTVEPDLERALRLAAASAAGGDVVVVPTYTAMLGLREVARRAGAVGAYWAETAATRTAPSAVVRERGSAAP